MNYLLAMLIFLSESCSELNIPIFTTLHVMQTRYSNENSVRLSVHLSQACIVTKRKKDLSTFLHHTKDNLA